MIYWFKVTIFHVKNKIEYFLQWNIINLVFTKFIHHNNFIQLNMLKSEYNCFPHLEMLHEGIMFCANIITITITITI